MNKITEEDIRSIGFKLFFPTNNDFYLEVELGKQLELLLQDGVYAVDIVNQHDEPASRRRIFTGPIASKEALEKIINNYDKLD